MLGDAKLFSDAKSAEIVISDNYCPRPVPTHINASALITTRKYLLIGLDFLPWFYDSMILWFSSTTRGWAKWMSRLVKEASECIERGKEKLFWARERRGKRKVTNPAIH